MLVLNINLNYNSSLFLSQQFSAKDVSLYFSYFIFYIKQENDYSIFFFTG